METMKLGNNISEVKNCGYESENSVMYRAVCSCTDNHHDQTLSLEYNEYNDEQPGLLELTIYHEIWYPDWKEENWFKKIWKRIKVSSKLLFTGEVELEGGFMFSGKEAVKDYIDALSSGLKKLSDKKIKAYRRS